MARMYSLDEVKLIAYLAQRYEEICQSRFRMNGIYSHAPYEVIRVLEQMRSYPEAFPLNQIPYLETIVNELKEASNFGSALHLG